MYIDQTIFNIILFNSLDTTDQQRFDDLAYDYYINLVELLIKYLVSIDNKPKELKEALHDLGDNIEDAKPEDYALVLLSAASDTVLAGQVAAIVSSYNKLFYEEHAKKMSDEQKLKVTQHLALQSEVSDEMILSLLKSLSNSSIMTKTAQ